MSKVVSCNCPTKPDVFTDTSDIFLDTLAQLRNPEQIDSFTPLQKGFQKRSRAKMLTDSMNFQLIDLESKLLKSYWQTWWCTRAVLQEGDKLKSRYCNQRWCLVCNRIRTAKLINGYIPSIDKLEDPQFVTLTRQTVDAIDLADTIKEMQSNLTKVKDRLRKQGIKLKGIRKIEIKYNELSDKYHPHYHLIVQGLQNAQSLVCEWVSCYSEDVCNIKAQDVRKADKKAPIELFKYFTKMLTDSGRFYPEQMDVIFQVMKGKRTFQPFGGIKKQSEDIRLDEQTNIDWLPPQTEIWVFEDANEFSDWYNAQGEPLSQVKMSEQTMQLRNNILEDNDNQRQTKSKANSTRYVRA